jgi:hypothetical protein
MFFVTGQKRTDRLTICQNCEHFVEATRSCGPLVTEAFTDSPLCGCFMPAKTKLKVASCPLGKWEAEISSELLEQIRDLVENPKEATNADLARLYSEATGSNTSTSTCNACNRKMLNELKKLLKDAATQA